MSVPAGWYTDPHEASLVRYWDGLRWTNHVQPAQPQQPVQTQTTVPQVPAPVHQAPQQSSVEQSGSGVGRKVGFFGARKTAESALADVDRLQRILDERGLLEFDEIEANRDELRRTAEKERQDWAAESQHLQNQLYALRTELAEAEGQLVAARASAVLQEVGLFDFEHPAEHSAQLAAKLDSVRARYKEMAGAKEAIHATSNFTFNNSARQGMKFVNQMSTIMLRAYNAEAENCVKTVKAGNLATATARLTKAKEQIERQGTMINLRVDETYHHLRIQEMNLAAEHLQVLAAEKEMERARREELREQKKAEAEIAAAREKLAKERAMHQATLDALIANGDLEGAERMRAKIVEDELALADVERRAANIRAGYVYVISNIGAFGENMVKIGMTRRLEPMDRVNELGDASVPFRFDVHALFYSDDAVATEGMLHRTFAEQRVNKVNLRREFFRVTPHQVLEVLKEQQVELVEFTEEPTAEEFRLSTPEVESLPV
ncbi:DUF4041 domain-containing protein [Paenarthrobacter sp. GOM3]|uniref:DUF4041 domain-containing protein n=1 Tax=Paenarthrobacter sp. GOM3 TaxID=2782567 RepID=UPI001BAAC197|nr:DUF4041 domain-containing protein [Paenarthrobacter sp. GOM3]WOH20569.1 DUF4041 domain-containing protein [Paenarthrobacter sp. GOM3]